MKWQGVTLVRQAVSYTYSPSEGYTYLPTFEGTPASITGVANAYKAKRVPFVVKNNGAIASLEAQHQMPEGGTAETPNGSWALVGSPEATDWRQHPKFLALTEDEQELIANCINGTFRDKPEDVETDWAAIGLPAAPSSNAMFFYRLAFNGQTHFSRTNRVLRHTLTVSQSYEAKLSGSNTDRVYTTAELLTECAAFNDPLPPLMIAEVGAIPAPLVNPPSGYIWGWLKQAPNIETVAGDRIQCSVEYVLESWPTIFYPAKS